MCLIEVIKAKILDFLKDHKPLVEVGRCCGKNESRVCSAALNSVYSEHMQAFLNSWFLGTTDLWIPRSTVVS
jgi:hypothetical protein